MGEQRSNTKMLTKLMFRILPVQILLAAVGAVNGIVSSFFATNFVGIDAMSAVGIYSPINLLIQAVSMVLFGGSVILCGKYMGQNQQEKLQKCFSVNIILTFIISALFIIAFIVMGLFDLTGFLAKDEAVRPLFNSYLLGQAIGILPFFLGNQLPAFLSLENKSRRTIVASLVYIVVNLILNFIFVKVLKLEAFGLALASAIGLWIFMGVQAQCFFTGKSHFKLSLKGIAWKEGLSILKVGYPGALNTGYQTVRGFIVNGLLTAYVGSVGISAFAAANNLLSIFWAIPTGMLAVSRLVMSISIGEEDKQTLTDCFRVMFRKYLPVLCAVSALLTVLAVPLTMIFYRDPSNEVYMMTVWGIRIMPWAMPVALICTHFVCYWQASNRYVIVHIISILDGFICVCGLTALFISIWGINSLYIANVANGVIMILVIFINSIIVNKRVPAHVDKLMCVPDNFGATDEDRMDLSVKNIDDVVTISSSIQDFFDGKGVEHRRAMLAGLSMEEMAGNIVDHGFTKDNKSHSIDVRVVYKDGDVILRLKDDCVPFDPEEKRKMAGNDDPAKNIGIKMVFKIAKNVEYQSLLGMNVLTIRL